MLPNVFRKWKEKTEQSKFSLYMNYRIRASSKITMPTTVIITGKNKEGSRDVERKIVGLPLVTSQCF